MQSPEPYSSFHTPEAVVEATQLVGDSTSSCSTDALSTLLFNLKKTIELWFLIEQSDEFSEIGGTQYNLLEALHAILIHGLKVDKSDGKFLQDLQWVHEMSLNRRQAGASNNYKSGCSLSLSDWLFRSLWENCLCSCLQILVTDKELLDNYYNGNVSYICNEKYATALFICLSAIELNQSSLLSQIDSTLYANQTKQNDEVDHDTSGERKIKKHKRSNSHPHFSILTRTITPGRNQIPPPQPKKRNFTTFRSWKSLPNLKEHPPPSRLRRKTFSQRTSCDVSGSRYMAKARHVYGRSLPSTSQLEPPIEIIQCEDIKIWQDVTEVENPKFTKTEGREIHSNPEIKRHTTPINSFFSSIFTGSPNKLSGLSWSFNNSSPRNQSGTSGTLSSSEGGGGSMFQSFFPTIEGEKFKIQNLFDSEDDLEQNLKRNEFTKVPHGGHTLTTFLKSTQLSRNNTDLEKENAHFRVSEAIICAIEHMKWEQMEKRKCQDDSRSRKHQKADNIFIERIGTPTFDNTDDIEHPSSSASEDELFQRPQIDSTNEHIVYAELDDSIKENLSAENVGLILLSKFNDKHLPKAAELQWLVSEHDVPQELLPMPDNSFTRNPEDHIVPQLTRGTWYWAPPRQQIIFTDHPIPIRRQIMEKQNYRCAGCGMKISKSYVNRFRYCTYLGKYHCTGCHRNQVSIIPAKVLAIWDFKCYPVSCFSYRLLEQIWTYPLFYLPYLNKELYSKVKTLEITKEKRIQLKYIKDFVMSCRFAAEEQKLFDEIADYITNEPDNWSMADLKASKTKGMLKTLQKLIDKCEKHVLNCVLCKARGFFCEFCQREEVFFPWQSKVTRCTVCGQCFHLICWKTVEKCIKCQRLTKRRFKEGP